MTDLELLLHTLSIYWAILFGVSIFPTAMIVLPLRKKENRNKKTILKTIQLVLLVYIYLIAITYLTIVLPYHSGWGVNK